MCMHEYYASIPQPQGGKLPLLLTPLTYIHVGNRGPCARGIACMDAGT
jgi:hypothetical protein